MWLWCVHDYRDGCCLPENETHLTHTEFTSIPFLDNLLNDSRNNFDTLFLGAVSLALVGFPPEIQPDDCNATVFALTLNRPGDSESLAFTGKPAHLRISKVLIHRWDCRSTHQATLTVGSSKVAVGLRRFDTVEVDFRTYVGVTQGYFHVATNLARFRDDIMDRLESTDFTDFTSEECRALRGLRVGFLLTGHIKRWC